jgi:hypothetical protein
MRVEIVHHQDHDLGLRIIDLQQAPNLVSPINPSATFGHGRPTPSAQRLGEQKYLGYAASLVLHVIPLRLARGCRNRRTNLSHQLLAGLVHADDWAG